MDVIGHKTETVDDQAEFARLFFEQVEKFYLVIIDKKYILLIIAPLGYVMWNVRYYNSCSSRHENEYRRQCKYVKKKPINVPYFPYFPGKRPLFSFCCLSPSSHTRYPKLKRSALLST